MGKVVKVEDKVIVRAGRKLIIRGDLQPTFEEFTALCKNSKFPCDHKLEFKKLYGSINVSKGSQKKAK